MIKEKVSSKTLKVTKCDYFPNRNIDCNLSAFICSASRKIKDNYDCPVEKKLLAFGGLVAKLQKLKDIADLDIKELTRSSEARAEAIGTNKAYEKVLVLLGITIEDV